MSFEMIGFGLSASDINSECWLLCEKAGAAECSATPASYRISALYSMKQSTWLMSTLSLCFASTWMSLPVTGEYTGSIP